VPVSVLDNIAFVVASCEIDVFGPAGREAMTSVEAKLTVADCSRIATLDFRAESEAGAANVLYKARLLRDVIVDFTEALETAVEDWR
jgi:hypothetical protein